MKISILIMVLTSALQECSYLHVMQPVKVGPEDWTLFGGSMERTNVARNTVVPPLSLAWEYEASAGFSAYSAATADSLLFIGNLQGELHAVNIGTGKDVGSYNFGSAIIGTPVTDNNRVFVSLTRAEGNLLCYNLLSGTIEWRANVGDIETSPLLIGKRLYVTTLEGKLICVEKINGYINWEYNIPKRDYATFVHSSPASDGNLIVFGCDDGTLYAVQLDDGTLRWSVTTGGSILASPSIDHGRVFVGSLDSTFYSYDLGTGKLIWKRSLGSKIYGSQAVGLDHIYVCTAGGTIHCLNEETGATVWEAVSKGVINATPLLSGTVLYVGCLDKTLSAFEAMSGKKIWEFMAEGRVKTMPVIAKNHLFLLAEDRSVMAFIHTGQQ